MSEQPKGTPINSPWKQNIPQITPSEAPNQQETSNSNIPVQESSSHRPKTPPKVPKLPPNKDYSHQNTKRSDEKESSFIHNKRSLTPSINDNVYYLDNSDYYHREKSEKSDNLSQISVSNFNRVFTINNNYNEDKEVYSDLYIEHNSNKESFPSISSRSVQELCQEHIIDFTITNKPNFLYFYINQIINRMIDTIQNQEDESKQPHSSSTKVIKNPGKFSILLVVRKVKSVSPTRKQRNIQGKKY